MTIKPRLIGKESPRDKPQPSQGDSNLCGYLNSKSFRPALLTQIVILLGPE